MILLSPILLIAYLLILLMQLMTDFYVPAMPRIGEYFNSTSSTMQLSFSLFILGMCFSHLLFAPLSDKIGRKHPLSTGVFISILGSVVCFYSSSVHLFIMGRFLQGLGVGCINSVGRSMMRDIMDSNQLARAGSVVGLLSILFMVISPVLGGYVTQHFGWRYNFLILIVVSAVTFTVLLIFLKETHPQASSQTLANFNLIAKMLQLLKNRNYISYTLCSCLAASGLLSWFTISSYIFSDLFHLTPVEMGLQNLYIAGAIFCSGLVNLILVQNLGIKKMVQLGCLLMMAGGGLLLFLTQTHYLVLISLMVSMSIFAMGCGLVFINAFAGAFETVAQIAGIAAMTYALLQDGLSYAVSHWITHDQFNNIHFLASLLTVLGVIAFTIVKKLPKNFYSPNQSLSQELL